MGTLWNTSYCTPIEDQIKSILPLGDLTLETITIDLYFEGCNK